MRISAARVGAICLSSLIGQPTLANHPGDFAMAPLPERCGASLAFVQTQLPARNERAVFSQGGWEPTTEAARRRDWGKPPARVGGRGAPQPPAELLNRMQRDGAINDAVEACASIRAYLARHRIKFGSAATHALSRADENGKFKGTIVSISLPVMTAKGDDAVVMSTEVSGILMSDMLLNYLHRGPDGKWRLVSVAVYAVG